MPTNWWKEFRSQYRAAKAEQAEQWRQAAETAYQNGIRLPAEGHGSRDLLLSAMEQVEKEQGA